MADITSKMHKRRLYGDMRDDESYIERRVKKLQDTEGEGGQTN